MGLGYIGLPTAIVAADNGIEVIGVDINPTSTEKAVDFYSRFVKGTLHKTNTRTAELCKLTENSSRDVQIAFANELSLICDKAGINVWELIELANKHPRVNILQPGSGVGGHCIAVDQRRWSKHFKNIPTSLRPSSASPASTARCSTRFCIFLRLCPITTSTS